jgi:hypothetical protein
MVIYGKGYTESGRSPPLKRGAGDFDLRHRSMTFKSPLPPFAKGGNFISGNRLIPGASDREPKKKPDS